MITKYSIPVVDGVAAGVDGAALLAIAALRRAGNAPSDGCTAQTQSVARCAICCKSLLRSALAAADRALRSATIAASSTSATSALETSAAVCATSSSAAAVSSRDAPASSVAALSTSLTANLAALYTASSSSPSSSVSSSAPTSLFGEGVVPRSSEDPRGAILGRAASRVSA